MILSQPLVLPPDVRLERLGDLAPALQAQLGRGPHEYLLFRSGSRAGAALVSADMAKLLMVFRIPRTVPEALKAFSDLWAPEDREDIKDCLGILDTLLRKSLLVPPGSEDARPLTASLREGDTIAGFSVVGNLHVARDTEVYRIRSPAGENNALKLGRSSLPGLREVVAQEIAVLELLGGVVAPRLISQGTYGGRAYGVLEWIEGVGPDVLVEDYTIGDDLEASEALLSLCGRILSAYAELHARGVLHGDVRPSNILVEETGAVRLVDFGLSRAGDQQEESYSPRGGTEPFLDPECARSLRQGSAPPPLTEAGEQYSVAALLFQLMTGEHYCRFGYSRREVLDQIVSTPPRSFAQCGVPAWPKVERLLGRALEKSPECRFSSLREMAELWRQIPPRRRARSGRTKGHGQNRLLEEARARLGLDGDFSRTLLGKGATASVNLGAAGISYGLYRISCATDDPEALAAAQVWLRIALDEARTRRGFSGVGEDPPPKMLRRISLHHSQTGLHLVRAVLGRATQNPDEETTGARDFVRSAGRGSDNLDITHGRAGVLLGAAHLYELAFYSARDSLAELGKDILGSLMVEVERPSPISASSEGLGVAHGWAGYLYAILRWCRAVKTPPAPAVFDRALELAELAQPGGRGLRWRCVGPSSESSPSFYLPGWCHGSAGFVHLFSLASEAFGYQHFLETAEGAGWDVWDSRSSSGYSLCCGLGGRAYALLNLYRRTGDTSWLRKAERLTDRAVEETLRRQDPGLEYSLYRGKTGIAVLLAELDRPEEAAMPFFEPEDWTSS